MPGPGVCVEDWGWAELGELVTSFGYGVLSAVVPLANAESYVVVSGMSSIGRAVPVVAGVALGQTLGKLLLFLGVRRGKQFPFVRRERARLQRRTVGPARRRFRAMVATLLRLVGEKRWGLPIVLLAAVTGFPPLYAVALLAGATRMRAGWFTAAVLVGRTARFVLVARGVAVLHPH
jgi:membrane protein DedA with SNARE-associated domain